MRFSIRKIASLPPVGGAPAFTVQAEEEEEEGEEEEKEEREEEEVEGGGRVGELYSAAL